MGSWPKREVTQREEGKVTAIVPYFVWLLLNDKNTCVQPKSNHRCRSGELTEDHVTVGKVCKKNLGEGWKRDFSRRNPRAPTL